MLLKSSALLLAAVTLHAASLGMATSDGPIKLNGATVTGTATLQDGSTLETTAAPSRLQLDNGARLDLLPNSRVRLSPERLVLEQGFADILTPGRLTIEARSLQVKPGSQDARARVALHGANLVQVAASQGAFRVYNASGVLVSNVAAGLALDFEPQDQGPAPPSSAIGCLLKRGDKFIIYDNATRLVVELLGSNLEREWGNRVQANGTARASGQPGAGSTQLLYVTSITRIAAEGCSETAAAIGAQAPGQIVAPAAKPEPGVIIRTPPAPAKTGGGMSAGTKVAIAAAVAGGGAGAYLATQKSRSN
ncbi:MAG: hypothetical protein FJW20_11710 [Acidimicrobiia bacterium]|nr:hypothetical protein [Acidimicrobiia bacterium]